jgi:hypothetical protein
LLIQVTTTQFQSRALFISRSAMVMRYKKDNKKFTDRQ